MTYLDQFLSVALTLIAWVQTSDGTNLVAALICFAALCGLTGRACLVATLVLHLLLVIV